MTQYAPLEATKEPPSKSKCAVEASGFARLGLGYDSLGVYSGFGCDWWCYKYCVLPDDFQD